MTTDDLREEMLCLLGNLRRGYQFDTSDEELLDRWLERLAIPAPPAESGQP